jgi:hypothetical protein
MVARGINVVHTNGIGTQRLHESGVKLALGRVDERIGGNELVRNTCREI